MTRRPTPGSRLRTAPLLVALPLALAACGGSGDAAGDSSAPDTTPAAAAAPATPAPDSAPPAAPAAAAGAMLDPNAATREQLVAAGMEGHAADALIAGRPYDNMVAVNRSLTAHVPDSAARKAVYARVWKPIDLNTATDEEILLIPGIGRRMLHEFKEYRPYRGIEQFRREIGKYVDSAEVARLEKYVTIRQ